MCLGEVKHPPPVPGVRYVGGVDYSGFSIEQKVKKLIVQEASRYWHNWRNLEISRRNWNELLNLLESRASKAYGVVLDDIPVIRMTGPAGSYNVRPSADLDDNQVNLVSV